MICYMFPGQGSSQINEIGEVEISDSFIHKFGEILGDFCGAEVSGSKQRGIFHDSLKNFCFLWNANSQQEFVTMGHSLGEYTALVVSGVLNPWIVANLLDVRDKAMNKFSRGAMVAILGDKIIEAEVPCYIANYNSPSQVVISGLEESLTNCLKWATIMGYKCKRLEVAGAFHSEFIASANEEISEYIEEMEFKKPENIFISSVSGKKEDDPAVIKGLLLKHMTSPVQWINAMYCAKDLGVSLFKECGGNKVLTNLLKAFNF